MKFRVLKCPEDVRPLSGRPRSYVMIQMWGYGGWVDGNYVNSLNLTQATVPDATILLTEFWSDRFGALEATYLQGNTINHISTGYTIPQYICLLPDGSKTYYHGSSINYLMANGRAVSLNPNVIANAQTANKIDPDWKVIR
jgi:hypothetical protein